MDTGKIAPSPLPPLPEELRFLQDAGECVNYQKGQTVFRQGEANKYIYVIRAGLLKGVYLTPEGKEYIKTLIREGDFIGSLTAQAPGGECSFSLHCLEPVFALQIPFAKVLKQAQTSLGPANMLIHALMGLAMKKERREYEFLCLPAEERYKRLLQRSPDLIERLTQNDIARYLGITPVALSRIRARLQQ